MRSTRFTVIAALLFTICGCSSTSDDPDMRRKIAAIELIERVPADHQYTTVQEVKARGCDTESAKTQLRVEAANVGADAVVSYLCQAKGLGILHCGETATPMECRGDAVKWKR